MVFDRVTGFDEDEVDIPRDAASGMNRRGCVDHSFVMKGGQWPYCTIEA